MFTSFTTVMVASWAMLLNVSDSQIAKPTCCLKQAYCCSIQAKCCSTELAIEKTVPSSKVEPRAEGQPTCCMKRAYCCSIKRSCCPNSDVNKLAEVSVSQTFMTSGETAQPTCCMKRAIGNSFRGSDSQPSHLLYEASLLLLHQAKLLSSGIS